MPFYDFILPIDHVSLTLDILYAMAGTEGYFGGPRVSNTHLSQVVYCARHAKVCSHSTHLSQGVPQSVILLSMYGQSTLLSQGVQQNGSTALKGLVIYRGQGEGGPETAFCPGS